MAATTVKDNLNHHDDNDALVLPYYCPEAELPAPLPTIAEIHASTDLLPCIFADRFIRRVNSHFLVKHGVNLKPHEAANMHFVATHTDRATLPIPTLYAAFHDNDNDGALYIIMEYIPGASLESLWPHLTRADRAAIATQLSTSFAALRSIPNNNNQNKFGRLHNQPYDDIFIGSEANNNAGPFATATAFHQALATRHARLNPSQPARSALYATHVLPQLDRAAPTFTHGDLQAKNILIRADDGRAVVIDWECAAWYPRYWEYTNALWTSRRWGPEDDGEGWIEFVEGVIGEGGFVVEFMCVDRLLGELLEAPPPGV